jgi:hypothetical protein
MGSICEMRSIVGLKGCGPSVDYEWSRKVEWDWRDERGGEVE